MKIKVSEATPRQLDWMVARCEGGVGENQLLGAWYAPSTDWAQGGPIIEREKIDILHEHDMRWVAVPQKGVERYGPTPLIAAMRCYVASQMGDEVEIPEELK